MSVLVAVAGLLLGGACAHEYTVEDRDTLVHVWLVAPAMAAQGGRLDALVYLGSEKVVEGPVAFAPGQSRVELAPAYVRTGAHAVSVVLEGGAVSATDTVGIEGESWVVIRVEGRQVSIGVTDEQPRG